MLHPGNHAGPSNRWFRILLAALAVFAAIALWAFSNNQQVGDSLGIAFYIKMGRDISNPHHLLYGPIVWLLHRGANWFVAVDVLSIGQLHNIFWSVVCIVSLSWVVKHFTRSTLYALLAGIVLLLSHQFWQYSTQIEVYVPALGCLALLLALMVYAAGRPIHKWLPWATVLLLMLSICYHQMGVLFLLPLSVLFYMQWGCKGLKSFMKIVLGAGSLTLAAYVAVYLVMYYPDASVAGFAKYCVHYAYSNPDWGTFQHFTKQEEVARIFHNVSGSFFAPYWAAKVPVWVTAAGLAIMFGWNAIAVWQKRVGYGLRLTLMLWLATYFLFLLWWTPGYEFFVMLVWPILLLVLMMLFDIAMLFKSFGRGAVLFLAVAVGALGFANFNAFKSYHEHRDEGYYKAAELMAFNEAGCWVITNFNVMLNLTYFHGFHNMIESDGLAVDYYYRDSIPPITQFEGMECVLTEMLYYNPWYGPMGENGFSKPEQWLLLNKNLFRFETDSLGRLAAAAPFEVFSSADSVPFLQVDRTHTVEVNGYKGFFSKMDSLVTLHGKEKDISYMLWYNQHKGLVP